MVDITEVCPDGSTLTTTATNTYEVLTRSICHTAMVSLPCYVCEFGLPTGAHLMTVATSSNSASPAPTPDVTVQMCSTCQTSVLSTSVVGYVPGTACLSCQPSAATGADVDPAPTPTPNLLGRRAVNATPLTGWAPAETRAPGSDGSALWSSSPKPLAPTASPSATGDDDDDDASWSSSPTAPAPAATFVTAGSGRNAVRGGGLVVLIFGLLMAVW
ncbi:hypothetical protein VPNG_02057 [Cytospora leucostoma]|uniref:Uncharacterized protein n=1 Tax=Cytospora leucostoma TaxID=1230097 RepID=A0A423XH38_9PEZI|nr:hypothetical protein VPNG_02057 [Cytospora leucostoma]